MTNTILGQEPEKELPGDTKLPSSTEDLQKLASLEKEDMDGPMETGSYT